MKWWGWLAAAAGGAIAWAGMVQILVGLDIIYGDDEAGRALVGGLLIVWAVCIFVPLTQKARRATLHAPASAAQGD